jgi:hypothetical protein
MLKANEAEKKSQLQQPPVRREQRKIIGEKADHMSSPEGQNVSKLHRLASTIPQSSVATEIRHLLMSSAQNSAPVAAATLGKQGECVQQDRPSHFDVALDQNPVDILPEHAKELKRRNDAFEEFRRSYRRNEVSSDDFQNSIMMRVMKYFVVPGNRTESSGLARAYHRSKGTCQRNQCEQRRYKRAEGSNRKEPD